MSPGPRAGHKPVVLAAGTSHLSPGGSMAAGRPGEGAPGLFPSEALRAPCNV